MLGEFPNDIMSLTSTPFSGIFQTASDLRVTNGALFREEVTTFCTKVAVREAETDG